MGALHFMCLFAAIVLSATNPIPLEELPEYELVEIIPEGHIVKRSLHRELASPLTGERISKRSLRTDFGTPLTGMERISLKTDEDMALTGIEKISKRSVFMPSFSKHRQARSIEFDTDVLDGNDVFKREKRQLFLPSFGRKRFGRSIPDEDMEAAETAVFLPGFARRG